MLLARFDSNQAMSLDTALVAVTDDDDQSALIDAVLDVAAPTGTSIVLMTAYTEDEYEATLAELDFEAQPSTDDVARRSQPVREAATSLDDAGVDYEVRGIVGDAGEAFVQLAEVIDADVLFIQGRSRSPAGKALFGSTAQTVLLNASCPVTFVRA